MLAVLKMILVAIIGFSGGVGVAGGVFAFISILQMIPRMACRLGVAGHIYQMETCIFLGGSAGSLLTLFPISLPVGNLGIAIFGVFAGIFIGCLSMALAETLKVIPILAQRTKLKVGLPWLITAMALGKAAGSFYQLYFCR